MQPTGDNQKFNKEEQVARLRLIRTERVGPITFRDLIRRFGTALDALKMLPDLARQAGRKSVPRIPSIKSIQDEMATTEKAGARYLFLGSSDYPARLAVTEDAPPVLIVFGHPHLLHRDSIAVVGPRNASAAGVKMARILVSTLTQNNLVIVSGMARGIDSAAHITGLETGTVACLAGGADHIYPRENEDLYWKLRDVGCIVSEMPLGTKPQARHFPRRNRIISGLSLGVLVIEAAERSGTLITARFAAEQGREVFAVPGSPLDPRAKGTNRLIREGAVLVEDTRDILNELDAIRRRPISEDEDLPLFRANPIPDPEPMSAKHLDTIRSLLGPTPLHIDDLVRLSELPTSAVLSALLILELAGDVVRYSGGRAARITSLDEDMME